MNALQAYCNLKKQHPDRLVIMRIKDFYVAFDDDAERLRQHTGNAMVMAPLGDVEVRVCGFHCTRLAETVAALIAGSVDICVAEGDKIIVNF